MEEKIQTKEIQESHYDSRYHRYKTIATQIAITASIGAALGGCLRILTLKPNPLKYGLQAGGITGGFGTVFFPLRNSMIQDEIEKLKQKKMPPSLRKDAAALYSSLVAGSATGGLAGIFKAGPYAIVPGMVLFGVGAGLIQGTYTALYRYRQDLLMDKSKPKAEARPPGWWLDVIVALLPDWFKVSKIPDDEYAAMLEANLDQLINLLESAEESLENVNSALAKEATNRKVIPLSEKH